MSNPAAHLIRFSDVEADLRSGEVCTAGNRVVLPEQPLRILVRLIKRAGDLVTREELQRELWPDNTFVDFEHGLNSAVKRLRDALGDSAETPRFIETVPRRGYRFIAPIETLAPPEDHAPAAPASPSSERRVATRPHVVLGILLLTSIAAIAGWLVITSIRSRQAVQPHVAYAAHKVVAVATFENRTADPSLDPLGPLTAARIIRTISTVKTAQVIPESIRPASPAGSSNDLEETVAGARRVRATIAVAGSYYRHGDRLEFQARILDVRSGQPLYLTPPIACQREEPDEALKQLEQAIAGAVAMHFDHAFGGLQITSHPPLLDAYLEYHAGRELFDRDYPRAVNHLNRALAISPEFFLSRLTLAMAYENVGDVEHTAAELARIADRADRLTKAERLLFEYLSESQARRPANAMRALHDVEKLAPDSWIVNYSIQMEALILNQPRIAIDAFDRLPLDDRYGRFNAWRLGVLARALHDVGDYERELKEMTRAQAYDPGHRRYAAGKTRALAALGRVDEVTRVIDQSLAVPASDRTTPGFVMELAAQELRVHRQYEGSRAVASRAVEWYRARPRAESVAETHRAALARVLYLAERWDESSTAFVALAAEHPGSVEYLGFLGALAARQGRPALAREISETLRNLAAPNLLGRQTYWRACIAALLAEKYEAVNLLREALGQGQYLGLSLHQSPHLEPLRDFPPFVDLMRRPVGPPPDTEAGLDGQ